MEKKSYTMAVYSSCHCHDSRVCMLQISLSVWPLIQSINFSLVPAKNRVMAISCGSFLWMVFLSYMQHTKADDLPQGLSTRRVHYDYHDGPREVFGYRPSTWKWEWFAIFPPNLLCDLLVDWHIKEDIPRKPSSICDKLHVPSVFF